MTTRAGPPAAPAAPEALDAQHVAEATREWMIKGDRASAMLGMQVRAVGPGSATLTMSVREDMLNGHDVCHGGIVATLADSAFAHACNAYNEVTVASGFDIDLLAAARLGDVLTARAAEVVRSGRTGLYDVEVTNQHAERVAVFRGRSYAAKGKPVIAGLPVGKRHTPFENK
ncbi:MAG: hydroxyphenylacetyl-CoA thioesterase PaaI [Rubrivivax sp.]|nr:hydroxyphenylacetyl-CoA thioesterase PaaI [Pseudomonadota bacterium]MCW5638054.1 hydroxyphenylacetyl-CoA thioesterase PaaI [Rubrivivax sp.]